MGKREQRGRAGEMVKKKEKKQRKWIPLTKGNLNDTIFQPGTLHTQLDSEEEIKCHVLFVPLLWRKGSAVGRQLTVLATSASVSALLRLRCHIILQTQHLLPLTRSPVLLACLGFLTTFTMI